MTNHPGRLQWNNNHENLGRSSCNETSSSNAPIDHHQRGQSDLNQFVRLHYGTRRLQSTYFTPLGLVLGLCMITTNAFAVYSYWEMGPGGGGTMTEVTRDKCGTSPCCRSGTEAVIGATPFTGTSAGTTPPVKGAVRAKSGVAK